MALKRIVLVFLLVLVAVPGRAGSSGPVIAVLGDSLSAGFGLEPGQSWVSLLEKRLASEGYGYRVVNASITGDTTSGGLARLPGLLERESPAVVIVELGGNDGLRGLPVKRMAANLTRMVELVQGAGGQVVLTGIQIPPNYGRQYTEAFSAVYPSLAEQFALPLVDFILDGVALDPSLMQADGIHPNAKAQPLILNNVWPVLEDLLRQQTVGISSDAAAYPNAELP